MARDMTNTILYSAVFICIVSILLYYTTYKRNEYFANVNASSAPKCAVTDTELRPYLTNIIKDLDIPANYDSNVDTQSEQRKKDLEIAKKGMKNVSDIFTKLFNNRNRCTYQYLQLSSAYAKNRGMLGRSSEQGNFEGVQFAARIFGYHSVIRADKPELESAYEEAESWISTMLRKYAPSLGGRTNNQFLYYVGPMMFAGLLDNDMNLILNMKDLLVKHMSGNFKNGFIVSELDRHHKTVAYHVYYINILWPILLLIKIFNIPFPWGRFKKDLKQVCEVLADPSTNTPGNVSLFKNKLKNKYDQSVLSAMLSIKDGGKHLDMYEYIFDVEEEVVTTVAGKQVTKTKMASIPSGFMLTGVSVTATLFVKALTVWKTSIVSFK